MNKHITDMISDYVRNYKLDYDSKTEWENPVVGFASAEDPLFFKLKEVVGENHIMPKDVLAGAKTVISYFIPFTEKLAETNKEGLSCSREWTCCLSLQKAVAAGLEA
ncbi:MAG: hypothetical protein AB9844_12110 [Clostridiaceae bacterium]